MQAAGVPWFVADDLVAEPGRGYCMGRGLCIQRGYGALSIIAASTSDVQAFMVFIVTLLHHSSAPVCRSSSCTNAEQRFIGFIV
jgi:hypothetical protein